MIPASLTLLIALQALGAHPSRDQAGPLAEAALQIVGARCLSCHGAPKSGGIDLRTRAATIASGALRMQAGETRLWRAVSSGRMPPTGKLPARELEVLQRWISAGAPYPAASSEEPAAKARRSLWSLRPISRPAVPRTPHDSLARNAVDRFVFAQLAARGLRPSAEADRRTLLRRVTLDLTGLPPTPDEMAAFLADRSPDAYEKVVDRLLASPAYGERWARHWLDVVRFGESHGYEQNHLRANAWPYRDYVIHAFNTDKPYNRFVLEQLAGDVVASGDPIGSVATGFLVAGIHDTVTIQEEQGTRQQRANDLEDIVSTTGAAFLGLTIGCAKCHDHKFDPISQRDYYRMAAVFAGVRHGEREVPRKRLTVKESEELRSLQERISELTDRINKIDSEARQTVLARRGEAPATRPAVSARRNEDTFAPVRARFVRFTIHATVDGAEPCLDELQVYAPDSDVNLALASRGARAAASGVLEGFAIHKVAHLNDGRFGNEWSWISNERGAGWAQIELPEATTVARVVWGRDGGEIPRFDDRLPNVYRIQVSLDGKRWTTVSTDAGRAGTSDYVHPDALREAMTPEQRKERAEADRSRRLALERATALEGRQKAYAGVFTKPEPVHLLQRGDVMQPQEEVAPGTIQSVTVRPALPPLPAEASDAERRLWLARWITHPSNPLTARVIVNRIWQGHFGRGIVPTASDFGFAGLPPSHPELLDWLAAGLVEGSLQSGKPDSRLAWRLKPLHRLLVTSHVYRQQTASRPEAARADASNELLWRMPLRRLEAEAIRDAILQTTGSLNRAMGGPGYRLFKYNVVNVAIYEPEHDHGPETWRRGIYAIQARGIRDDLLGVFDCPESSVRTPRRDSTTTALQALSLLNGPFMLRQAERMADRIRTAGAASAADQARAAFRLTLCRSPEPSELAEAALLVQQHGLPALCRALMNTNEFLYY